MISTNFRIIKNEFQLEEAKKELDKFYNENGYVEVEARTAKTRTQRQNRALHVFCRQLAERLRSGGIDTSGFFKEGFEVPFTTEIVKNNIWKPVQRAVTKKESSSKLSRTEVSQVFDVINRLLADKGIHVPWPEKKNDD